MKRSFFSCCNAAPCFKQEFFGQCNLHWAKNRNFFRAATVRRALNRNFFVNVICREQKTVIYSVLLKNLLEDLV